MSGPQTVFTIVGEEDCPHYVEGDGFQLSGNALLLELEQDKTFVTTAIVKGPKDKKACRRLISDLTRLLIEYESVDRIPDDTFPCSGCSGRIEVKHLKAAAGVIIPAEREKTKNIDLIADLLSNFSIFQSLDKHHLKDIVAYLKLKKYNQGTTILTKGAPAQHLYIILSGAVDVMDEKGVRLSTLKRGDVFGEMSLISGDPVGATIKVVESATIIFIKGNEFRNILNKFPSIQMYLARLLARRLAKSNVVMAEEIASGMIGHLAEINATELMQTLNQNQKSGILSFSFGNHRAEFHFRKGELVKAVHGKTQGSEAFFKLLREREGRFKFVPKSPDQMVQTPPVGLFMELLLEGLRRLDEDSHTDETPGQMLV